MQADSKPDQQLLRRSAAGDAEAFTALYRRHQPGVYRFALHMSGSEAVAEEVAQEVFLVLIRDPGQFDCTRGALGAFLHGIARNHVLRHLEHGRRHVALDVESGIAPPAGGDLAADVARSRRVGQVRAAVLALPARYREVVVLCDLHEKSYAEAAALTGCAVGTIRSRLHRARGFLAAKLRERCLV